MGEVHRTVPLGVVSGAARVVLPGTQRDCGECRTRGHGMDGIRELLSSVRDNGLAAAHFRGLLHIAIGRKITRPDGTIVSTGLTWRALALELKSLRFDQDLVRQLGTDPDTLASRDRERFWYAAIAAAHVDTQEAFIAGDQLAPKLKALGFQVGPPPTTHFPAASSRAKSSEAKPTAPPEKPKDKDGKNAKKKKK